MWADEYGVTDGPEDRLVGMAYMGRPYVSALVGVDLIPRIMDAGVYIEVSQRLGVSVYESTFIKPPSVTQFPPLLSAQQSSSLAIGQKLEKKLETVEKAIEEGKGRALDFSATEGRFLFREVPSADDLVRRNEAILPPPADEVVPEGERFTFTKTNEDWSSISRRNRFGRVWSIQSWSFR